MGANGGGRDGSLRPTRPLDEAKDDVHVTTFTTDPSVGPNPKPLRIVK